MDCSEFHQFRQVTAIDNCFRTNGLGWLVDRLLLLDTSSADGSWLEARRKLVDIATVIVAAGRGTRLNAVGTAGPRGSATAENRGPKQYQMLAGQPVLAHTIAAFAACPELGRIIVVIHRDDHDFYRDASTAWRQRLEPPVEGHGT